MATAVGVVPKGQIGFPDDYLLDELLICGWCRRDMAPAPSVDGTRWYDCGPPCPRPPVLALPLEQDVLIRAMVRAYVVLYEVGRPSSDEREELFPWGVVGQLDVSAAERQRWNLCELTDRRALLRTAYAYLLVDETGAVHPVWRHETEREATS